MSNLPSGDHRDRNVESWQWLAINLVLNSSCSLLPPRTGDPIELHLQQSPPFRSFVTRSNSSYDKFPPSFLCNQAGAQCGPAEQMSWFFLNWSDRNFNRIIAISCSPRNCWDSIHPPTVSVTTTASSRIVVSRTLKWGRLVWWLLVQNWFVLLCVNNGNNTRNTLLLLDYPRKGPRRDTAAAALGLFTNDDLGRGNHYDPIVFPTIQRFLLWPDHHFLVTFLLRLCVS